MGVRSHQEVISGGIHGHGAGDGIIQVKHVFYHLVPFTHPNLFFTNVPENKAELQNWRELLILLPGSFSNSSTHPHGTHIYSLALSSNYFCMTAHGWGSVLSGVLGVLF